jgi:hypothetical protein
MPSSSWFHSRGTKMVQYMKINKYNIALKKNKNKNHMVISIDEKKTL